jgi:two-component system, OmpR family, phosphate regulon sensor histidine kinase PhoR
LSLGIRGKLFITSLALVAVVGLVGGLYLENELTRLELQQLDNELLRRARSARESVHGLGAPTPASIDPIADRLGQASDARITFIDSEGKVIGDSALSVAEIEREENHARRPEVVAAMGGHASVVRRFSTTLGKELVYAAVPWYEVHGAVRASTPLETVQDLLTRQRILLLLAAGLGLLLAVLVSAVASHLAARAMGSFAADARALVSGGRGRLPVLSEDELGQLASSLNRLADDRSQTIAALVKERDRLNTILHGVSEGLLALDAERRVELINQAAKNFLGVTAAPEGRKLVETIRIPALVELAELPPDSVRTLEFAVDDPPRYLMATTTPLRATGGTVIVLHDVTGIRNMESMRRDLVANVSHELRTPVSIIRANAETLLDGALEDPEQSRSFLQAILRHAERLSNLLSDLLDLARIEGGAYPLCLEDVSLRTAAQRAVDTLQRAAKARGLSLHLDVEPHLVAHADIQALDQVLVNLLDNAIKYSYEGGAIEVSAGFDADDLVRISVSDDGPGIQERHRGRVFERFYRVDTGRSRALGGTGLGLSIVKHLVVLMHGSVGVDAVQPHGSSFWVKLPRGTLAAPQVVSTLSH